ncbi:YiiX/YebB-like N1pC/P60 family cysteine hydrolase [Candidatus Vampirococcus lugosii]|uniref:Uncharacterized protein n=1 Tax=Candidatus Vampirococcus lugosii TaxID=2789015 RepID=A0ABS5QK73_9BACT|nr:YiiX/YebB-like N1pC/P60 family cysteine hydrolase [Candidatus Vampirococcus lugosii]MBS8121652.1 hypothetical protein [Candidatus Vampirococcus lugosii]
MRTTFSENKIKRAIGKVISNVNKDYDFSFDFNSDKYFVCSELIIKSYMKEYKNDEGLDITLKRILYSISYEPNEIVKKAFYEKNSNNKQIYPILFIDSILKKKKNFINTNEEFLKSYKRSRTSIFLK